MKESSSLTRGFRDTLDLILPLHSVAVVGIVRSVDDLIREAFSDGLNVPESLVPSTDGHHVDGDIDTAERRHIHRLQTDNTRGTDSSGVFPRTTVLDSVHEDLNWVLSGHETDDLEGLLHDLDRLTVWRR